MIGGDWYRSLSWKLAGISILVVAIVATIVGAFFLRIAINKTVEDSGKQLQTIAENVDSSVTNLLWALNEEGLKVTARDLINDSLIGYVEIRDENGDSLVALSDRIGGNTEEQDLVRRWVAEEIGVMKVEVPLVHASNDFVELGDQNQIEPMRTRIGELILHPSLSTVSSRVQQSFQASLQAMLLTGMTFALTIFLLTVINVTRPLNRLSRTLLVTYRDGQEKSLIQQLSGFRRKDEIGQVADRFQHVLARFLEGRDKLVTSERIFRDLIEGSVQSWIISRNERVLFSNQAAAEMFGYENVESFQNTDLMPTFPTVGDGYASHVFKLSELAPSETRVLAEEKRLKRDGTPFYVEGLVRQVNWIDGPAMQTVLVDITEKRRTRAELQDMAVKDRLTGLPNRTLFHEEVEQAIKSSDSQRFSMMSIGINRFKTIRDRHGATGAEEILKMVAERLQSALSDQEAILSRLGESTFGVLAPRQNTNARIASLGYGLLDALKKPFILDDLSVELQASIGVAIFPNDGASFDDLQKNAEIAMDSALQQTEKRLQLYDPVLGQSVLDRLDTEIALRNAIGSDAIELFYQPKIMAKSGKLAGFEALARWKRPDQGFVPPDRFIPIAEETGLIVPLGEQLLTIAARQISDWMANNNLSIPIAVNMSALQLTSENFPTFYKKTVERFGIPPALLQLELTESATAEALDDLLPMLRSLRDYGCLLALDDFGTGYSSLSYLKRMPIKYLKLDRSFVEDLPDNDAMALARIISMLGHELGMELIAEGVEDEQTAMILKGLGYDQFQGYLYSRPLPPEEATAWLQQYQA